MVCTDLLSPWKRVSMVRWDAPPRVFLFGSRGSVVGPFQTNRAMSLDGSPFSWPWAWYSDTRVCNRDGLGPVLGPVRTAVRYRGSGHTAAAAG